MINRHYIKPGGIDPTKKVYYNRPQINNVPSYYNNDEGWLFANNFDAYVPITDGVYQEKDLSVNPDYLLYYNSFGHKFRFTGLNGGYYDFNDSTYKDVNGAASTFNIEFRDPVDTTTPSTNDGYIIDHLTGLGWRSIRWGSGGETFYTALNYITTVNSTGLTIWNLHPYNDWFMPTLDYAYTLIRLDLTYSTRALQRAPFQYDQPDIWTGTTYAYNTLYCFQPQFDGPQPAYLALKTSTNSANRCAIRLHYSRTDYVLQP